MNGQKDWYLKPYFENENHELPSVVIEGVVNTH
jgi:hypothetical protein